MVYLFWLLRISAGNHVEANPDQLVGTLNDSNSGSQACKMTRSSKERASLQPKRIMRTKMSRWPILWRKRN
ncbi:hypothetical protein BDP27DRAFT_1318417 [Rhodocollybia butyracea]|uniref:Uncharacterized protein n=1 Tax=Rhodocollybia butyracea TaxID=206335 RepID=A0A9P5UAY0_9AGAR|nr:hypothetical protein BDP27DRAFT_1318417 [Rhodocollybia butyracea]